MINVAVVAFEGVSLFHLSVPVAIFKDATPHDQHLFNVKICAESEGQLITSNGLSIDIEHNISILEEADIIIFPSWEPDIVPSKPLINILKESHNKEKVIVGLCIGAYALAYSGLLNGKRATTHWKYKYDFVEKFPLIYGDINPLFIDDNNVITSAGSAAAIDCCLYIVKRFYGVKMANSIARIMVSSPERSGGQNQYIESPILTKPSDERIAKLMDYILENITSNYQLADVSAYCLMSVRSFSRNFKANNGISFTAWLINVRLNYSLELLESTNFSITSISEKSGFSTEQVFRKQFKQRYDTTPKLWRNMFKSQNK